MNQTQGSAPLRLKIAGMDCGSCAMTIENSMRQLPGVRSATVSFTTETMELVGDAPLEAVTARLRELGYRLAAETPRTEAVVERRHGLAGFVDFLWSQARLRVALLATAALLVAIPLLQSGPAIAGIPALDWIFAAAVIGIGLPIFVKGFRALLFARRVTIDLLMAIAACGALAIGETGEAVTVILLYTLGEALEAYSAARARDSLRSLMSLQPQEATVLREHRGGHGSEAAAGGHEHDGHACSGHDHEHDHGHSHAPGHAGRHGHAHAGHDHDSHTCGGHDHDHDHKEAPGHGAARSEHEHEQAEGHAHEHGHQHGDTHEHAGHSHAHDEGHAHGAAQACSGHDHADHAHDHAPAHDQGAGHGHARSREQQHARDDSHDGGVHYHATAVPVESVAVGETVLVRPGQRIPLDGLVLKGESTINQSHVTGESEPVLRVVGDEVLAGAVNGDGALEIRVTRPAGDATIARIARLVEQAQSERSPAERFIDRFARWYTPAVVLVALLVVLVPVLAFGQPLLDTADGTRGWLYRGLALLIIACPCALVISIPVTVVSSLTRLANLGVLVKGGAQLDALADVRAVAFDKTGTLTHGRPQVTAVRAAQCEHTEAVLVGCDPCDEVVALAAAVERSSEHPVAHAIVDAAAGRQLQHRYQPATRVVAHAGRGVRGELGDGVSVAVGSDRLFGEAATTAAASLAATVDASRAAGQTVMYVARNESIVGYIGVRDAVRLASSQALAELHAANPTVAAVMLTGDTPQSAARVAEQVGNIDAVHAGLLPEQKLAAIEQLRDRYGSVAMVGDGINDAPALARADVGIAMGAGTAQAMETADVVLMQDDLSHVPMALRLARRSRQLVKQNIALSLGLKLAFLALAIPGFTTLWMAVLADVGATMLVTINGMRVLRES
ncbi:MAG: heavy metal translocating P-type ATPase [Chromatiales bacterium]|jgi:heavy metal translocating P-type ATPase|nr:heavy metal translocating P-type ATPase [Chromatiales bacterium]